MDNYFRDKLYSELRIIADSLCVNDTSKENQNDLSASLPILFQNNSLKALGNCDIYSGAGGIALFLMEVYKVNTEEKYLKSAIIILKWVNKNYQSDSNLTTSFFTGSIGITFLFFKAYQLSKDEELLAYGKAAYNFYLKQTVEINPTPDLINGIVGEIIGLLHIHEMQKDEKIIEQIDLRLKLIIDEPILMKTGIAWVNSIRTKQPLCGLSHGAAGIGFLFFELAYYFQNNTFQWLGEQTFLYEDACYNPNVNNWPDYRTPLRDEDYEEHCSKIKSGDLDYFLIPAYHNAWCHGAAGIGLARLRAFEISNESKYKIATINAVNCTIESDIKDTSCTFELCHGNSGNADLFINASSLDHSFFDYAKKICLRFFDYQKENEYFNYRVKSEIYGRDISLFRGDAGVGYFYLRVLTEGKTPSVLLPEIKSKHASIQLKNYQTIGISLNEFKLKTLTKTFPKTINLLKEGKYDSLNKYFFENDNLDIENWYEYIKNNLSDEMINDALTYEHSTYTYLNKNINMALWNIKTLIREKEAENIQDLSYDADNKLFLPEEILLIETKWNWSEETIENLKIGNYYFIYLYGSLGLTKIKISEFNFFVLETIKNNPLVSIKQLSSIIEKAMEEDTLVDVNAILVKQINEFLKIGVLSLSDHTLSTFVA